jgi:hypothetical protein
MKRILFSLVLFINILQAQAIIYRHDINKEEQILLAKQQQFNCVGEVINTLKQKKAGSCVFIGNRYVLTAAHVLIETEFRADTMTISGKQIISRTETNRRIADITNYSFRFEQSTYKGKKVMVFPAYLDSATRGQYDIALIELDQPVENLIPATLCKAFDELGSQITIVGFGASGNAARPADVGLYDIKYGGENIIDSLCGYKYNDTHALLSFDFDYPGTQKYNRMGSADALPLESICGGGDSGGGMFRQTKAGWQLVGICAGAQVDVKLLTEIGYYGNTGNYTRVSIFNDWIKEHIAIFEKERK